MILPLPSMSLALLCHSASFAATSVSSFTERCGSLIEGMNENRSNVALYLCSNIQLPLMK